MFYGGRPLVKILGPCRIVYQTSVVDSRYLIYEVTLNYFSSCKMWAEKEEKSKIILLEVYKKGKIVSPFLISALSGS